MLSVRVLGYKITDLSQLWSHLSLRLSQRLNRVWRAAAGAECSSHTKGTGWVVRFKQDN